MNAPVTTKMNETKLQIPVLNLDSQELLAKSTDGGQPKILTMLTS
jgi:hypothetical protein